MFKRAYREHFAVGAFNVDNLETLQAVIEAASETKSPVSPSGTGNTFSASTFARLISSILAPVDTILRNSVLFIVFCILLLADGA